MFCITGITGQVGGEVANHLLAANRPVRAAVRSPGKATAWADRGCEVVKADITDTVALAAAFKGAEAVFLLVPPNFDPSPDFAEARAIAATLKGALQAARPGGVVYLSTIGAQATRSNLLTQHTIIEQALERLPMPMAFLRPGWFMENCKWDVAEAREDGVIASFLQPLDRRVPMVATADIGRVAAQLLQDVTKQDVTKGDVTNVRRVVELEGPHRVSPDEIAGTFAGLLGRPVKAEAVPRESWEQLFTSQGMKSPMPRIRMLDGFNEGWIEFESGQAGSRKGEVALKTVLQALIERDSN
jgi:uncharacterized protein YbjT (DUF2867 family)